MGKAVCVGDYWFVALGEDVRLGPYEDQDIATEDAEMVRSFLARMNREEEATRCPASGFAGID